MNHKKQLESYNDVMFDIRRQISICECDESSSDKKLEELQITLKILKGNAELLKTITKLTNQEEEIYA